MKPRRILLIAAIVATVGDALAYAVFIGAGLSREMNPLWNGVSLWLALAGKAAIVVVLVAIANTRYGRAVLAVAVVVGSIGIFSTIGSLA